jgi:hypothetical protein
MGRGLLRGLDQLVDDVLGVAPSGLPMPKSMMSSPRLRASAFSSPVMLKCGGTWVPRVFPVAQLRWNCPGSVAKRPGPPNLVLILMKGHDPKSIAAEIRTTFVIDETLGSCNQMGRLS